jgi:CelD/BcsL family acetyltransferase involved in cellulose biosynthesis
MRVTVVRPGDLGPSESVLWAKYQQTPPVTLSPFLSLTFAQAVGRARPSARVAVVEDAGRIEAFLPFEVDAARMAVPIGHPMNNLQGFIGSGAPIDARAVVRQAGLRGWRFKDAPADQTALAPFHYPEARAECPLVDLASGYQAYLEGLSKSLTTETARRRRALRRHLGPVSLTWHSQKPEEDVGRLIAWKSGMYGGTRELFAEPAARRIVEELCAGQEDDCAGVVSVLAAGEEPFAVALWLTSAHGLAAWFASYNSDFRRSSPGTMILLAAAEEAINRGITLIDLGGGQDSYKHRLANGSYQVAGGAVWAHRAEEMGRRIYRRLARLKAERRAS